MPHPAPTVPAAEIPMPAGAEPRAVADARALLKAVYDRALAWNYTPAEIVVTKRGPMVGLKWLVGNRALSICAFGGGRCETALFPDRSGAALIGFCDLGMAADLAAWFACMPAAAHTVIEPAAPAPAESRG